MTDLDAPVTRGQLKIAMNMLRKEIVKAVGTVLPETLSPLQRRLDAVEVKLAGLENARQALSRALARRDNDRRGERAGAR